MPILAAVAVPHPPLIIPQVGRGEEKGIQATINAYQKAAALVAELKLETVVVASPHAEAYLDGFELSAEGRAAGSFAPYGAPQAAVEAQLDPSLSAAVAAQAEERGLPVGLARGAEGRQLDHGTMIPLHFLQAAGWQGKLVRVGISGLPLARHYQLGQCVAAAAEGKAVAFIASGDLSHKLLAEGPYGFAPEGPRLDAAITGALAEGDFAALLAISPALASGGAECGLRSFVMMAGALDGRQVDAELLSYEGPFGVGYAVATFLPGGPDDRRHFLAP